MNTSTANPDLQSFDLSGVVAMVTGASGGIGLHIAGVLARAGDRVALAARRKAKVDEAASELCQQGHQAIGVALDVSKPETHEAAFESVAAGLGGPPQVLVNNGNWFALKLPGQNMRLRQMVIHG